MLLRHLGCLALFGFASAAGASSVRLEVEPDRVTIDNGLIVAELNPRGGELRSLRFGGRDLLGEPAYLDWHDGRQRRMGAARVEVRGDPVSSADGRAEVAFVQAWSGQAGGSALDVELHYVLRPGERALRMFAVFSHPADYPAAGFGQSRYVVRVRDDLFDGISVDEARTHRMPAADTPVEVLGPKESMRFLEGPWKGAITDKYHYFTESGGHFFHGWTSFTSQLGLWVVYGSTEDQNGGPTRQHNTAHWPDLLLKILSCGHYGAPSVEVPAGRAWEKVYGPWALYANTGDEEEQRADAARQAEAERADYPPAWLEHSAFPPAAARGAVSGRLMLRDPGAPGLTAAGAWVGLAEPSPDWQRQALGYQPWTRADADGRFVLKGVRAGELTLYAFVDGVLGEFRRDGVAVEPGKALALGDLEWRPVRYGREVWQIGVPDRSSREFRLGGGPRRWGRWNELAEAFPEGVNYVVGRDDPAVAWGFSQGTRPGTSGAGWAGTTWRVLFTTTERAGAGEAVLRQAFAGAHNASLKVTLDGAELGERRGLGSDNALARAGVHGQYVTWDLRFPAARLGPGDHVLALEQQAGGSPFKNVMYDCLRLEAP